MGTVYRVLRPELGRIFALKRLEPDELLTMLLGPEKVRDLFLAEAGRMGALAHPHIAAVTDIGFDGDAPYMVMEYFCADVGTVIGESYEVERRSRPLSPERSFRYVLQTLAGLERMHYAGIIHRDIKPFNLMLDEEDRIKIIDLGLSRLRGEVQQTPSNLKVGSPYYTAPELEQDPDRADHRADLYSVGVLLYRLLTGILPDLDPERKQGRVTLEPLGSSFFSTALHTDPEKRFQTAAAMREAVQALRGDWLKTRERFCVLPDEEPNRPAPLQRVRATPVRTGPVSAERVFDLGSAGEPVTRWHNRFEKETQGWTDRRTGLFWAERVSPFPLPRRESARYLDDLRRETGIAGFRLPTVDELLTLLAPRNGLKDFCSLPLPAASGKRVWSADFRSHVSGWYVDLEGGYVGHQDETCRFFLLAVATISGPDISLHLPEEETPGEANSTKEEK
jgi:serine/threonine-protein kinase